MAQGNLINNTDSQKNSKFCTWINFKFYDSSKWPN